MLNLRGRPASAKGEILSNADLRLRAGGAVRVAVALLVGALIMGLAASQAAPAGAADQATQAAKKKKGKKKKKKKKTQKVRVMTRNVYLGADLGPGLTAANTNELIDNAGQVVNQVDATNFPVRSQALAAEILQNKPDLVGLQEVALWRTGPFDLANDATQVEYDFLQLLTDQLGSAYKVIVVKEEFDFETPVNDQGPTPAGIGGADRDARLTMRDVILARTSKQVKVSNATSGTFPTLLRVTVGGNTLDVTRGWTAVDAKVGKSKKFRFVNLHHEAFDSGPNNPTNQGTVVGQGQIREAQAKSLIAPGGPATGKLPVVLLGDLNSDDDTVGNDGDVLAYNALTAGGFRPVDTSNPMSCCLNDPNLVAGSLADFDHHIDHVMTNSKQVKFLSGVVTGRAPVNGLWPSDHNGVQSLLSMPQDKGKKKGKKKKKKKKGKK